VGTALASITTTSSTAPKRATRRLLDLITPA
jgi:hypothetical protein